MSKIAARKLQTTTTSMEGKITRILEDHLPFTTMLVLALPPQI